MDRLSPRGVGRGYRTARVCLQRERRDLDHWVGKASDETKSEVKVAPEILAKYVGTYVEQPRLWRLVPRVVEITVAGDTLYGNMDGRGKVPLVAQAETNFSGLNGLGVEFTKNEAASDGYHSYS